ncbi:MAG: hypothetical protein ACQCN4_11450 [Candidatus Bathyarchaeia archaeon]
MDDNTTIIILNVLLFAGPIILLAVGALIYDQLQKRKTHIGDNYRCRNCDHIFPQKTATISGFETHPYGLHVNCPKCGATIEQFIKPKKTNNMPIQKERGVKI